MDVTFSSFYTQWRTLFRPNLMKLFASLWIEFTWVAFLNSILYFWHLSPLWNIASFSLMSFIISTNSNVLFAKMKLKFCFCFEKSIWIRTTFNKVDLKQRRSSNNSMQSYSFFFDNRTSPETTSFCFSVATVNDEYRKPEFKIKPTL